MAPYFAYEVDWDYVFQSQLVNGRRHPYDPPYGLTRYTIGHDFEVLVAESYEAAELAVQELTQHCQEGDNVPLFGLDLEWRPTFRRGQTSPVSMIQLSCSSKIVLLRVCRFQFQLPQNLFEDIFMNPDCTLAAAGFDNCDRTKLWDTFGVDSNGWYCNVADIQHIARNNGYERVGLKYLARALLSENFTKPKSDQMCNWEAHTIEPRTLKYAALDAACAEGIFWKLEEC